MVKSYQQLKKGSKGKDVQNLNTFLRDFFRGIVDVKNYEKASKDIFDKETENELKLFQKYYKLKESGILDKKTFLTINNIKCISLPIHGYNSGKAANPEFDIVTNPDHQQYQAEHYFFGKTDLTYTFKNFTNLYEEHTTPQVALDKSSSEEKQRDIMDYISKEISTKTKFTLKEDTSGKPDIFLEFTTAYPEGDPRLGTTVPPLRDTTTGCRKTDYSPLLINDRKSWTDNASILRYGYKNLTATLLHEIGHSFSLAHTPRETSVMYYNYNEKRQKLAQDDIDGYNYVYNIIKTRLQC